MSTNDAHVFEGLAGLATRLYTPTSPSKNGLGPQREWSLRRGADEDERQDRASHQRHPISKSRSSTGRGEMMTQGSSRRSLGGGVNQTTSRQSFRSQSSLSNKSDVSSLDRLALLKHLTISKAPSYNVMQDLYTPYRSYIFNEDIKGRDLTAPAWVNARATMKRHELIRSIDEKHRNHKVRMIKRKGKDAGAIAARFVPTSERRQSSQPSDQALSRGLSPSMLSFLTMTPQDIPNELSGPFREDDGMMMKPAIRQMSTFEDYLERTVNAVRATPIRLDQNATAKLLDRKEFQPAWTRKSLTPQPMMDQASINLAKRAERAATSLGFAPSREVVNMHRQVPPYQIDPGIYVRAGMAAA